ncbi:MAG: molybdopterin binding aldehyde oxidase/xanthine dehydrogenase [Olpidium bornovanus]|uniref:Molybdopterin binding aldehyde oxidase/xanthine dehydrogenase n=1 Tax=Olpidium bornovanus TaxID=278681 RepID=A0A8H7ZT58_9FUNG|nr:MAG: molybdopterin binding aldehyde oxidase/xanthine dehydrogenase [Olpidium bornovanus]
MWLERVGTDRECPFTPRYRAESWRGTARGAWGQLIDLTPRLLKYAYFTQGGAYSEVEIDVLSGDFTILRTDIVMDVGRSLNMGIDVGQVEGAFVQGMGLMTLEETLVFPNGRIQTIGPGFRDIPQEFNINLLKGARYPHLKTIGSSKGVGEPPLFLGSTVLFAIRDAVKAARSDAGLAVSGENVVPFRLDSPATAERIRLACQDDIVKRTAVKAAPHEKNWVVTL